MFNVILVNDEALEIEAIKIMIDDLTDELLIVGTAENGKIAIEKDKELEPDIIIMDNEMPGINGIEASKIIKDRNKEKIIILLMEYYNFKYEKVDLQVNDYILKPINKNYLIEILNRQIINLKTNSNKLKEQELLLLDKIISNEENGVKILLKNILEGYILQGNNDIYVFRGKVQILLDKIIKIFAKIKSKSKEEINNQLYMEKLYSLNSLTSISSLMNEVLDIIYKDNTECIIREKLIGNREISKVLEPVLNYIEENYKEKITLQSAARSCNLSIFYFSKLFKKDIGMNFIDYINLYKIEKSKEILSTTDMPILNIAIHLGYDESGYFSKVFKKIVGITPTEYRNK
ncbi:DNA-binding response regulator [Clostridium uliginosum]|uniref:Stage 0 sporulation protein A homolog n=1 Tax=Clostridium uliginosum TaxID=119641 RepID=A0A1I1S383_9CLOT|nr:AraC family transcriptional regulator [Clostridium uliginosum]SFD40949.1 two-component system, response regulator YesN [Clostridium uliginosum]